MGLFSGTKLTTADVEQETHARIKQIVRRLSNGEIDPPDAVQQLTDLIIRSAQAMTRVLAREEK